VVLLILVLVNLLLFLEQRNKVNVGKNQSRLSVAAGVVPHHLLAEKSK